MNTTSPINTANAGQGVNMSNTAGKPLHKSLTPEEIENLMCRRVLIADRASLKIVETHVWELSANRKFVYLGSKAPNDKELGWVSLTDIDILDILPEDYFTSRAIQKRLQRLKELNKQTSRDISGFIFRL